jgi:pSer/pThr/pTyr-binding forkhead associated (FHA) protein
MNVRRSMAHDSAATVRMTTVDMAYDIVLKPVSHPEIGDIRIDENLFAIGRTEPPFSDYPPKVVADLSRRHARIFSENGEVYIADLDSKNGTKVNGVEVQQKITKLNDNDEICFGGHLTYTVRLGKPKERAVTATRLVAVVLNPERDDLGLQPIIVTSFPFLISKADDAFARYKDEFPHQVNYLSRRHAHIFLKGGQAFVEDLGSTNGTFVGGKRLDEHAVPLNDGDTLAFGGHHFVYKVSLHQEDLAAEPTVTKLSTMIQSVVHTHTTTGNPDKTTFVAAPDSFLDIFCVDHVQKQEDEINDAAAKQQDESSRDGGKRKPRGKAAIFIAELAGAFRGGESAISKRGLRILGVGAAALIGIALVMRLTGAPEREMKDLLADGDYARASEVASRRLALSPGSAELKALGTEALLKARVPEWVALLKARNFDGASGVLTGMKDAARHNDYAQPLLAELEWMGELERFVLGRGGVDAPIRIYMDEEKIRQLLRRWDDSTQQHQRAFATISAYVPAFEETYSEALSHLRKLQNDEAVYLAAIDRLKASIADELKKDRPEALEQVLNEYAEKYPRIGGLDSVRQDLRAYTEIDGAVREQNLARLAPRLEKAKFSTPAFQARFRALGTANQLPPAELLSQYQAANKAWREGRAEASFAAMEKLSAGPWGKSVGSQVQRRKSIVEQFGALQKTRGSRDYDESLLAFYGSLDPDDDVYFIRATEGDIQRNKDKALTRAQELMNRAQSSWKQYRDNGPIEGAQRLESGISGQFRTQARLLTDARQSAQQGLLIAKQLRAESPAQWTRLRDEIVTEAEQQRKAMQDLRLVLEPALWKEKLELLGGSGNEH